MKVAFFFDTFLLKDKKNDYWGMTLTYDFLKERYLKYFDEMIIVVRQKDKIKEKGNTSGYKKTNGDRIYVEPVRNYREIPDAIMKRKEIEREINDKVKKIDKAIIRMPSVIGMFACESCIKNNKPYIIEMVACPWDGYLNHIRKGGKILAPIMTLLTKKYIKNAPRVLYVTNEFLQKRYPSNGISIACSDVVLEENDINVLNRRLDKIENKEKNGILKLATVASVELKYKGQEYVIKAIANLKKKNVRFEYYLIGNGNNSRLKEIAKKYNVEQEVHFMGSLRHEQVFEMLDKIDVYIQPSLQEGLPRALIEAMSRACPAIGSNAGGIPELLDKEYIFKRKNISQLEKILVQLNVEKLKEQAKRNYEKSLNYSKDILENKREEFYYNI